MVQQVADSFLAAGTDCVVQQRAASRVSLCEVPSCLVQLLQLRTEESRAGSPGALKDMMVSLAPGAQAPQGP